MHFEITDPVLNEFRLKLIDSFWNKQEVVNENTMSKDRLELEKLPEAEQEFILSILAFFATGDDAVIDIIYNVLNPHITCSSWKNYEIMKAANEMIHSETYSGLIDFLAPEKKQELLKGINFDFVHEKLKFVNRYLFCTDAKEINANNLELFRTCSENQENTVLAVFMLMITEQLFFSSSFCAIFWYKETKEILRGLAISNELISRDEGMHYAAGLYVYKKLGGLPAEMVKNIIMEAVKIEHNFCMRITPEAAGMNPKLMMTYVETIADGILEDVGCEKIYGATNPFSFMSQFGTKKKVDFFHRKSTAYNTFINEPYDPKKM